MLVGLALVVLSIWLTGDDEYTITAQFQNASALVRGNEVVIGAQPVGTVKEIRPRSGRPGERHVHH